MKHSQIDVSGVNDWAGFHECFARKFEFPDYYGRNMDAWIDCMEDYALEQDSLVLHIDGMPKLKETCPEIYEAICECAAFINYRARDSGGETFLALSYSS